MRRKVISIAIVSVLTSAIIVSTGVAFANNSAGTIIHSEVLEDSEEYLIENSEGLTLRNEAEGKVKESEAQELLDEYGKDANIIIYDVGYTKQYEEEITRK